MINKTGVSYETVETFLAHYAGAGLVPWTWLELEDGYPVALLGEFKCNIAAHQTAAGDNDVK